MDLELSPEEAELRHAKGDTVMMIGHNPGIAEFAHRLVARAPLHEGFAKYPTGATMVADFSIDRWEDAAFGGASALDFTVPRELAS